MIDRQPDSQRCSVGDGPVSSVLAVAWLVSEIHVLAHPWCLDDSVE